MQGLRSKNIGRRPFFWPEPAGPDVNSGSALIK